VENPADFRFSDGKACAGAADAAVGSFVEHQLYRAGDPVAKGAVELSGVRSLVGLPLVKDDASVGALMIGRREARPFSDKQVALLQNFAAQALPKLSGRCGSVNGPSPEPAATRRMRRNRISPSAQS
jgi:GAF domain